VNEDSVHVLVGQQVWVVTRLRPQFNARHTTFEAAAAQARQIATRDHGTLLVHDSRGDIVTRESFRES